VLKSAAKQCAVNVTWFSLALFHLIRLKSRNNRSCDVKHYPRAKKTARSVGALRALISSANEKITSYEEEEGRELGAVSYGV